MILLDSAGRSLGTLAAPGPPDRRARILRANTASPWPLADASVDHIVTSPPYPMLRVYGADVREIGREGSIGAWVADQVRVFGEGRRVLKPHGTMLVNLGDKRPSKGGTSAGGGYRGGKATVPRSKADRSPRDPIPGLRGLAGAPWRFALAMQEDGWVLVADMIWNPPDASPETLYGWSWVRCRRRVRGGSVRRGESANRSGEAVTHTRSTLEVAEWEPCPGCSKCEASGGYVLQRGRWRPTTAHQYMFLFAKGGAPWYWDQFATLEPTTGRTHAGRKPSPKAFANGGKLNVSWAAATGAAVEMRNARTVQTWLKGQFAGADLGVLGADGELVDHHATFTVEMPLWSIRGGTSEAGNCGACGEPWARVVERRSPEHEWVSLPQSKGNGTAGSGKACAGAVASWSESGFRPTCACGAEPVPAVVLDPYAGAGTTLLAAEMLGRRGIGLELYTDNCRLSQRRLQVELRPRETEHVPRRLATITGPLFEG